MSVQGFIVGLCVLVALGYVLRPSLRRWMQRGQQAHEASEHTAGGQPPGACGACSACSGCPSGKPRT